MKTFRQNDMMNMKRYATHTLSILWCNSPKINYPTFTLMAGFLMKVARLAAFHVCICWTCDTTNVKFISTLACLYLIPHQIPLFCSAPTQRKGENRPKKGCRREWKMVRWVSRLSVPPSNFLSKCTFYIVPLADPPGAGRRASCRFSFSFPLFSQRRSL